MERADMNTLIPYLTLPNQCEEALNFYADCFGGQITFIQTYAQSDYEASEAYQHKITHAEFTAPGIHFYASDGFEDDDIIAGNNVGLTLNCSSSQEQQRLFEKLKQGGLVTMPLATTSINTTLTSLIDQYGIHWYLNLEPAN